MNLPQHLGIILDGNRRFAKSLNQDLWKGHEFGYKKVLDLLKWCKEFDIKELTLYVFSIQNFNRPKIEFNFLMKLFEKAASEAIKKDEKDKRKEDVKISFIGRLNMLPKKIQEYINKIQDRTKDNKSYKLNFAMAYGGREELEDAMKQIAKKIALGEIKAEEINQEIIDDHCYMSSKPDLIIRTGGEKRTSNFLVWQSSYSEWIFLDKKWPEFTKSDFINCLDEYSLRQRRFGK